MLEHHGENCGSILTSSSLHNQVIKRLWRDLFQSVIVTFYCLFYHMEHHRTLDQLNEVDLHALHLPMINKSLDCFRSSWKVSSPHTLKACLYKAYYIIHKSLNIRVHIHIAKLCVAIHFVLRSE